ncbi:MAG TPA: hypothetical protein VFE05_16575 [Longimicrobiaceae bacterium]|nr:hypothetical protein [Longimicrobiaceae bacterium]
MSDSTRVVLAVVAVLLCFLLVPGLYRWAAFRDERALIVRLRREVVDAGAEVTLTRAQMETLRTHIEAADSVIRGDVDALERYTAIAQNGMLPPPVYQRYEQQRRRYEEHLAERDAMFARLKSVLVRNHASVGRYNLLSDSIRSLAARIGDPYYHVPLPVEAAAERGLIKIH